LHSFGDRRSAASTQSESRSVAQGLEKRGAVPSKVGNCGTAPRGRAVCGDGETALV